MTYDNEMIVTMKSKSENEAFARVCVAAFVSQLDPTVGEISEIKTAVSEAVTNAIIHGYENGNGDVILSCKYKDNEVFIEIKDDGIGIDNIEEAMTPLFTSKPDMERSGMGFTVMESFMDKVSVISEKDNGTKILMTKKLSRIE